MKLLNDLEWSQWSDREIARRCGVAHPFVGKLRPVPNEPSGNGFQMERKVQRNGTVYTQNTANIGGSQRPRPEPADDRPVFDSTPTGRLESMGASPERAAAGERVTRDAERGEKVDAEALRLVAGY